MPHSRKARSISGRRRTVVRFSDEIHSSGTDTVGLGLSHSRPKKENSFTDCCRGQSCPPSSRVPRDSRRTKEENLLEKYFVLDIERTGKFFKKNLLESYFFGGIERTHVYFGCGNKRLGLERNSRDVSWFGGEERTRDSHESTDESEEQGSNEVTECILQKYDRYRQKSKAIDFSRRESHERKSSGEKTDSEESEGKTDFGARNEKDDDTEDSESASFDDTVKPSAAADKGRRPSGGRGVPLTPERRVERQDSSRKLCYETSTESLSLSDNRRYSNDPGGEVTAATASSSLASSSDDRGHSREPSKGTRDICARNEKADDIEDSENVSFDDTVKPSAADDKGRKTSGMSGISTGPLTPERRVERRDPSRKLCYETSTESLSLSGNGRHSNDHGKEANSSAIASSSEEMLEGCIQETEEIVDAPLKLPTTPFGKEEELRETALGRIVPSQEVSESVEEDRGGSLSSSYSSESSPGVKPSKKSGEDNGVCSANSPTDSQYGFDVKEDDHDEKVEQHADERPDTAAHLTGTATPTGISSQSSGTSGSCDSSKEDSDSHSVPFAASANEENVREVERKQTSTRDDQLGMRKTDALIQKYHVNSKAEVGVGSADMVREDSFMSDETSSASVGSRKDGHVTSSKARTQQDDGHVVKRPKYRGFHQDDEDVEDKVGSGEEDDSEGEGMNAKKRLTRYFRSLSPFNVFSKTLKQAMDDKSSAIPDDVSPRSNERRGRSLNRDAIKEVLTKLTPFKKLRRDLDDAFSPHGGTNLVPPNLTESLAEAKQSDGSYSLEELDRLGYSTHIFGYGSVEAIGEAETAPPKRERQAESFIARSLSPFRKDKQRKEEKTDVPMEKKFKRGKTAIATFLRNLSPNRKLEKPLNWPRLPPFAITEGGLSGNVVNTGALERGTGAEGPGEVVGGKIGSRDTREGKLHQSAEDAEAESRESSSASNKWDSDSETQAIAERRDVNSKKSGSLNHTDGSKKWDSDDSETEAKADRLDVNSTKSGSLNHTDESNKWNSDSETEAKADRLDVNSTKSGSLNHTDRSNTWDSDSETEAKADRLDVNFKKSGSLNHTDGGSSVMSDWDAEPPEQADGGSSVMSDWDTDPAEEVAGPDHESIETVNLKQGDSMKQASSGGVESLQKSPLIADPQSSAVSNSEDGAKCRDYDVEDHEYRSSVDQPAPDRGMSMRSVDMPMKLSDGTRNGIIDSNFNAGGSAQSKEQEKHQEGTEISDHDVSDDRNCPAVDSLTLGCDDSVLNGESGSSGNKPDDVCVGAAAETSQGNQIIELKQPGEEVKSGCDSEGQEVTKDLDVKVESADQSTGHTFTWSYQSLHEIQSDSLKQTFPKEAGDESAKERRVTKSDDTESLDGPLVEAGGQDVEDPGGQKLKESETRGIVERATADVTGPKHEECNSVSKSPPPKSTANSTLSIASNETSISNGDRPTALVAEGILDEQILQDRPRMQSIVSQPPPPPNGFLFGDNSKRHGIISQHPPKPPEILLPAPIWPNMPSPPQKREMPNEEERMTDRWLQPGVLPDSTCVRKLSKLPKEYRPSPAAPVSDVVGDLDGHGLSPTKKKPSGKRRTPEEEKVANATLVQKKWFETRAPREALSNLPSLAAEELTTDGPGDLAGRVSVVLGKDEAVKEDGGDREEKRMMVSKKWYESRALDEALSGLQTADIAALANPEQKTDKSRKTNGLESVLMAPSKREKLAPLPNAKSKPVHDVGRKSSLEAAEVNADLENARWFNTPPKAPFAPAPSLIG